ncbi:hypothetical protein [Bradyrhizobium sp. USDA 329]
MSFAFLTRFARRFDLLRECRIPTQQIGDELRAGYSQLIPASGNSR